MAKCDVCGKEMLEAKGCVGPDVRSTEKCTKGSGWGQKETCLPDTGAWTARPHAVTAAAEWAGCTTGGVTWRHAQNAANSSSAVHAKTWT